MWSGHEDILDVTEKELAWVGFIWFGSIALICATVGTMRRFDFFYYDNRRRS